MNNKVIRVLLGKAGLDAHDRGVRLIARGLRDRGMEVIYTGLYRTVEEIVETALQEDVDVVGLSVHTGSPHELFSQLRELLDSKKASDILVIGGGVIAETPREELKESGLAAEIFGPGTSISAVADWINEAMAARKG